MTIRALLVFLSVLVLAGCGSRTAGDVIKTAARPGSIVTNTATKSWINLSADYPIVCVGRLYLTKGEVEYACDHVRRDALARVKDPKRLHKIWSGMRKELPWKIVSDFVARASFSLEAEERGLKPGEADLKLAESSISNRYTNFAADFMKYRKGYPRPGYVDEIIRQEAASKLVFDVVFSNSLDVTEAELDEILQGLNDRQRKSNQENELLLKAANRIVADYNSKNATVALLKGQTLPKDFVIDDFADAPMSAFDDEEAFLSAISMLKPGRMSQPCTTDAAIEMYVITNVTEKVGGSPRLYSGVKVSVPRDLGYEIPTRANLKGHLRELRDQEIVQPYLREISLKFGILFTQGFVWTDMSSPYSMLGKDNRK